ncbi:protease inhibitor I42 family protein [Pseudomonas guariconensis]|uniref:protease inhibitor I42 family protein n=1 Tax=Pseudomonas TaxID=286 RepID=UPI001CE4AC97|nr:MULTISPECIES: protease inhibitor I42 family protein [Pseudomonas]MCO7641729.1 protease inhibitor I42 family protein [Pseudomonas sp. S 311-6]MCO7516626.1 protease inhibitor I42 family protein [Pseudomonas putida]MCO7566908.1 protease inhibitor I42 family protein [Pseudomonas mosselii]MCO7596838.1 protease inhibitor I42 family protein [Pseudomonas guariconensis]MCO7606940.1 protease inhibitor I42 family protein [Pseudomonas guariconensis]
MTVLRLLVPLSLALLAACAQQPRQNVDLDAESECPRHLQVGQTLTLTLPSNPSTGYRWLLQDPAANILRSLGPEVYSAPEEAGIVGSAGVSTWRFQAQAAGEGHLILVYQQPWAPEVRPVQTFDCTIRVQ